MDRASHVPETAVVMNNNVAVPRNKTSPNFMSVQWEGLKPLENVENKGSKGRNGGFALGGNASCNSSAMLCIVGQ